MQRYVFIVHCERVRRTSSYYLRFLPNDQLQDRIKKLPYETRKWHPSKLLWEVKAYSLFLLIKKYKNSKKIHFDFGSNESRNIFIFQIKKLEKKEEEKRKFIAELNVKKDEWVKFKQELEENYLKYSDDLHKFLNDGIKLYPHQIMAAMYINITRNVLISHEMGLGKAQPIDSKILTDYGYVDMGNLNVGDNVIGSDGKNKKVLQIFPQGIKDIYRVTFNDGTSTECCDEHLWNVNTYIRNWRGNPYQTKTLREIMNIGLTFDNGNRKHYIPIVKPVEFETKDLNIDPYVLGCLLGDGSIVSKYTIGFSSIDKELINEVKCRLPNKHQLVKSGESHKDYYLTADGKNNLINQALTRYGLKERNSHTKFIPQIYKIASIDQRLSLLQGILDTDGHSRTDSIVELTLASKQLITDVQFIVQTLGGIGRLSEKWVTYNNERRLYYRLHIKLPPEYTPFKLKRKIATFVPPTKYLPNRAIKNIEYVGKKEAKCILIDSEDHLYCTDSCILTHNTLSSIVYVEMNGFDKVIVITPNSLKFNYYNEVKKFTKSTAYVINWRKNTCTMEDAKYVIFNYEYFNSSNAKLEDESKRKRKRFDDKWAEIKDDIGLIDCVIADECFTYDTMVDTEIGRLKIGDIVEKKLDVNVLSYNHELKKIERKAIKRYLYNGYKNVVCVKLSNGNVIECTPEHKFYSFDRNEYVAIKDFKYGEKIIKINYKKLFKLSKRISNKRLFDKKMLFCCMFNGTEMEGKWEKINELQMPTLQSRFSTKKKISNLLFNELFSKINSKRKYNKKKRNIRKTWEFITNSFKKLRILWCGIRGKEKIKKTFLFNQLFSKMENVAITNKRSSTFKRSRKKNIGIIKNEIREKSEIKGRHIKTNDIKQSYEESNQCRKDEEKKDWLYLSFKRWKWEINKTTIKTIFNNIWRHIYGNGTHNTNKKTIERDECCCRISSNTLQSGYRNTINKIGNRSGWEFTQNEKMEVFGQKKNKYIEIIWVESIEILESGNRYESSRSSESNKKGVYDLEIKDNHNYFANGVLVSNCHRLKNTKSNTYKNYKRIFSSKIFRDRKISKVYLSGTPAPNRAYELYTILNQISPVDFPTKRYFYEYYCGMVYDQENGYGWENNGESKLEELYHRIAPFTHRKRKAEVLTDLPDKIYQKIMLEMSDSEYTEYSKIEGDTVDELEIHRYSNPLTIMLRLRQYVSQLKVKHVLDLVNNIIDTGEKIVIVDVFKDSLYLLKEKLGDIAALHTGDQSVEERAEIVQKFQDPDSNLKIFLGSIQTCNYGLTLTAANKLFILSLPFVPGEYDQVADRCILKGELVLTKNGYIEIENISIGDLVYTHKGNWKKVNYVSSKLERKKAFYDIKYKGFHKPLRCTEDHKIFIYDKSDEKFKWLLASELNIINHYMVLSKYDNSNYSNKFIIEGRNTKSHNKTIINKKILINKDILYAFGRFVGDGYANDHQVCICGHIDEYNEVLYSINSIKSAFNIENHSEYKRDNKIEMYISSIELTINFKKWFGVKAINKKIPEFIFNLDNNEIRFFLNGYYDADGYQRNHTQQASTASKFLSYQLILLESKLGNSPTIYYNNAARVWSFEYSLKNKMKRNTLIKNIDNHVLFPIEKILIYKPKRGDERVYDLSVDDDNSFVVGLSSVHNCHRIGQKNVVNIYPLMFYDTIDDYVYSAIESKRVEIMKVIDNEDYTSDITESVMSDVIEMIKKKHGRSL